MDMELLIKRHNYNHTIYKGNESTYNKIKGVEDAKFKREFKFTNRRNI